MSSGQLLRRFRALAGLTQEELAERSAYSTDYISKLERDQRRLPLAVIDRLAEVLGLGDREREELRAARERHGTAGAAPGERELIGREPELAAIRHQLAGLGPHVLLLAGEPGIGKTRLLEKAAVWGAQAGWRVIDGGCQRWTQDPYAPLTDALARSLQKLPPQDRTTALRDAAWLELLLPELLMADDGRAGQPGDVKERQRRRLAPEQERRLLFAAVARYLHGVAREAGTLLVLDDLHWAGPDALDLLASLARASNAPPIRIVGAYRDSETGACAPVGNLVADLARASLVRVLALGPLSPAEAAQLLAERVTAGDERQQALLPTIFRRAGGVPLFLVSYADDLQLRAGAEPERELPWTVAQVIRQRVLGLPGPVQQLLGVAAVVGRVVPRSLLSHVAGLTEEEVLAGLETAAAARLLLEEGEHSYQFSHDLIRETIERDLSTGRRQLLHRRIGEALEHDPSASIEVLAFHFALSDDPVKGLHYLEQAGDEAQLRLAYAAAAGFFHQALSRLPGADRLQDAAPLEEKLGTALYRDGQYAEAIAALERALAGYREASDGEAVQRATGRLADAHFRRGTGRDILEHVAALAEDSTPSVAANGSRGAIALQVGLARLLFGQGAYRRMLRIGRSLATVGHVARNSRVRELGERIEGIALVCLGRLPEGIAVLEAMMPEMLAADDRERAAELGLVLTGAYLSVGSLDHSEALSLEMLQHVEPLNDPLITATYTIIRGTALHIQGDWERANPRLTRADELLRLVNSPFWAVRLVGTLRIPCLVWEGRWEEARRYLEAILDTARPMRDVVTTHLADCYLAELDLLEGRPEASLARLAPLATTDPVWSFSVPLFSTLAGAYLEVGELARARDVADRAVTESRRMEAWTQGVWALRVRGMIAARQGEHARARDAFEEGLRRAESMPFPYAQARLLHAYGLLEQQRGDHAPANQKLSQALDIFERLGATKDIERLRGAIQESRANAERHQQCGGGAAAGQ